MNKKLDNKYSYALIVGVSTFVGVLVLIFAIIKPLYIKSSELRAEQKTKEAKLAMLKEKKSKLEELKDREDELIKDSKKVESALPTNDEAGRLFIQLDAITNKSGGLIKSVNQSSNLTTSNVGSTGIKKISFNSSSDFSTYFGFKDFVEKSEDALRIVEIAGLNLSSSETGSISATIIANTYARN